MSMNMKLHSLIEKPQKKVCVGKSKKSRYFMNIDSFYIKLF